MSKNFKGALALTLSVALLCGFSATKVSAQGPATEGSGADGQALTMLFAGKDQQAKDILLTAYTEQSKSGTLQCDIPYFLALFELRDNDEARAIKYLHEALKLDKSNDPKSKMLLTKRLADCEYHAHEPRRALTQYNLVHADALKYPNIPPILTAELLESIAACETELKMNTEAEQHLKELIAITAQGAKSKDLAAVVRHWWALAQLADFYRLTNQPDKLEIVKQQLRPILTGMVEARAEAEAQGKMQDFDTLVRQYRQQYINAYGPDSPAELAWAALDFRVKSLPVIAWKTNNAKPLAAILCIHGLGLENRAFADTAKELNRRGYQVYALDVRGFGSWAQTKGVEELDYTQTITDIGNAVQVIKERNNNIPVYVLGESMGGAIALRAASHLGKKIDGVISSVPSAERFQQKKMTLQTTLHFLKDPKQPFDVGYVAEMATSNQETLKRWEEDPNARLAMTPVELLEFAVFMRRTKPHAEQITELPVLMLQGLKDRLVKPQGTFDLFDAVKSPDKTILIIGTAEHLMFENPHPDKMLMDTVDSWLKGHTRTEQALKPSAY